ncbi:bifunctional glutamine-synthetase adenylyltransferase/deadenyltransferase, partial [Pasteurella multocida subsp. multocida str. Anand1_cattle]
KQPHFLHQCWQQCPRLQDCEQYAERLTPLLAQVENEEQLYKVLRQFRHREMAN